MSRSKRKKSDDSDESPLERRVDAMMDVHTSEAPRDAKAGAGTAPLYPDANEAPAEDSAGEEPAEMQPDSDVSVVGDTSAEPAAPVTESAEPIPADETDSEAGSQTAGGPDDPADPQTDALVDDIVVHEGDELLAAHDARLERARQRTADKPGLSERLNDVLAAWWANKWARYLTLLVVLAGLGALAVTPTSRYYALNLAGVRASASLSVTDNTTQLPLKNVIVELGGRRAKTNQEGTVKLSGLKLGSQALAISQSGFATITRTVTLGLGSNPLGGYTLNAVGTQFHFKLIDYLSGQPVTNADISSGDANARSDSKGQLVLTVDQSTPDSQKATITADGYRPEQVSLSAGDRQSGAIVMVPSAPEIFISKQSGRYDLYTMDIDGQNKRVLLPASGLEDDNISLVVNAGGSEAALVSRRDNSVNQDGYPLQALTLVDVAKGTTLTLDHSESIRLINWFGDTVVYVKIKAGTSAGNPSRYQLMSYNFDTTARLQLAAANYFSDIVTAQGAIYYAASNNFAGGDSQLVRIGPDNTGKQVLLDKTDVWNITRTGQATLTWTALDGSYSYTIGNAAPSKASNAAANPSDARFYLDADDGKHMLWTDSRDGKGVLLVNNTATGKDTTLATQSGLTYPLRWLNARTVVYRVDTPSETADYAVSLDGGAPRKVTDLTNTAGVGLFGYR